ncbi:hypothetical protein QR680_014475 [Steinernema hermaphroditum]|uniref:Uncharacterized protein n=1 Tax=Steinernema hermaphroditum TaxID=289476 RepID=A0AA39IBN6_9BILA|nr:hypothetical protein QR680_014475 [Steinernema hermaphroditum]
MKAAVICGLLLITSAYACAPIANPDISNESIADLTGRQAVLTEQIEQLENDIELKKDELEELRADNPNIELVESLKEEIGQIEAAKEEIEEAEREARDAKEEEDRIRRELEALGINPDELLEDELRRARRDDKAAKVAALKKKLAEAKAKRKMAEAKVDNLKEKHKDALKVTDEDLAEKKTEYDALVKMNKSVIGAYEKKKAELEALEKKKEAAQNKLDDVEQKISKLDPNAVPTDPAKLIKKLTQWKKMIAQADFNIEVAKADVDREKAIVDTGKANHKDSSEYVQMLVEEKKKAFELWSKFDDLAFKFNETKENLLIADIDLAVAKRDLSSDAEVEKLQLIRNEKYEEFDDVAKRFRLVQKEYEQQGEPHVSRVELLADKLAIQLPAIHLELKVLELKLYKKNLAKAEKDKAALEKEVNKIRKQLEEFKSKNPNANIPLLEPDSKIQLSALKEKEKELEKFLADSNAKIEEEKKIRMEIDRKTEADRNSTIAEFEQADKEAIPVMKAREELPGLEEKKLEADLTYTDLQTRYDIAEPESARAQLAKELIAAETNLKKAYAAYREKRTFVRNGETTLDEVKVQIQERALDMLAQNIKAYWEVDMKEKARADATRALENLKNKLQESQHVSTF